MIPAFAEARGYPIERANYITDLKRTTCGAKIDIKNVNLNAPVKLTKAESKNRPNAKHHGPRSAPYPPMGPPGPMAPPRRGFMNGAPFPPPPPPGKFGPPRPLGFGPPRAPLPPPPHYGPTHPPPPPMRQRPMGPPGPPGPPGMRVPPGPSRLPMGPPVPLMGPSRHPVMPPISGPPRPLVPPPLMMPPKKMIKGPGKGPVTRSGGKVNKQAKELDFTADVFEENLTTRPVGRAGRKRPFSKN